MAITYGIGQFVGSAVGWGSESLGPASRDGSFILAAAQEEAEGQDGFPVPRPEADTVLVASVSAT